MGLWFFCCWAAAVDREPCAASQGCCGAPQHTCQSGMGNRLRQCVMRRPRSVVLPDRRVAVLVFCDQMGGFLFMTS